MKIKNLKCIAIVVAATVAVAGVVHLGTTRTAGGTESTLGLLSETSVVELPAVAASLVHQAKGQSRSAAVQEVIKNTVALDRACALPFVVSAICQQAPDMAPQAVICAVQNQPQDAVACVQSGVAAAPQQAEAIVFAFVKEFPEAYAGIAFLAAKTVPDKGAAILNAVGQALPALQPYVQQALAEAGAGQIDMAKTLAQVADASAAAEQEKNHSVSHQTLSQTVASSQVGTRIVEDAKKGQWAPVAQYVNAEIAKANVPAKTSARFASSPVAPKLIIPATLKVPTPSDVKSVSADLGVRGGLIYSRP